MRSVADTGAPALRPHWRHRLGGVGVLALFGAGVAWLVVQAALALRDGWVAPLQLSPEHEQVVQLRQRLLHEKFELERVEAEAVRAGDEIGAIDEGLRRLAALRDGARRAVSWQAGVQEGEVRTLARSVTRLAREGALLRRTQARQQKLADRAEADLRAGLVDRFTAAREAQSLDAISASLLASERALGEARARLAQAGDNVRGLRGESALPAVRHPEYSQAEEREARLELEITRLQAERRGLEAVRRTALHGVEQARALVAELEGRPLHRALAGPVDVAFVPYPQLAGVSAGARVIACTGGLFACRTVGRVEEIVDGEVVTQDPWGELARGRYALLALADPAAIREKVLRIRR